jgi:hypothetical protein
MNPAMSRIISIELSLFRLIFAFFTVFHHKVNITMPDLRDTMKQAFQG